MAGLLPGRRTSLALLAVLVVLLRFWPQQQPVLEPAGHSIAVDGPPPPPLPRRRPPPSPTAAAPARPTRNATRTATAAARRPADDSAPRCTRVLLLGLQSSGVSLFATMLGMLPRTIVVPNLFAGFLPPRPEDLTDVPAGWRYVVAARINANVTPAATVARFRPDLAVLWLRHPVASHLSLSAKPAANRAGTVDAKLRLLEAVHSRRGDDGGLAFNATLHLEGVFLHREAFEMKLAATLGLSDVETRLML